MSLNGVSVDKWSPGRRARFGVTRSFQSLELFEDLTVRENLLAASDSRDALAYISNLAWKGKQVLPVAALAAIREFDLEADLDRMAVELPFGRRRLVGIARAIATGASAISLDEPGAGLRDDERGELANIIRHMAKEWGMSVLLVEHDVSLVMSTCDRIVVLEYGHKLSEGSPEEIRGDGKGSGLVSRSSSRGHKRTNRFDVCTALGRALTKPVRHTEFSAKAGHSMERVKQCVS